MSHWRRLLVGAVGAVALLGVGVPNVGAHDTLIEFDSMTPVGHPPTIERTVPGGGFAWSITSGEGSVDRQGNVDAKVTGLIITALGNTGPITAFQVVVSCETPQGTIVNSPPSSGVPTTTSGDSTIETAVDLPHPCKNPEVLVGASPKGSFVWFAHSNAEDDD